MANNQLKEELILSTQHFDKKIDDVVKRMNKLQNQGNKVGFGFNNSMGKMIQKATGFDGSMTSILGTVTKLGGALGVITSGVQLADWFKNAVAEGTKLAQEGEGIRLAFERLNRGDLLANLRRETHGTVTDLELMKQAVKFNDFKLSLDDMGTFLAFAQQKAKDTGQSIDYMVDSIVTGLGRKSLPILDNLGLSAAEIREKMKDGGDMTKAVAEIIKEKMKESGDYVETAADRAKQKEVELQNELEKLGRTFQPLTESSNNLFHSIEIGAIKAASKIGELANNFTELGRIQNNYNKFGGTDKVGRMINNLGDGKTQGQKNIYENQLKEFDRFIKKYQDKIKKNPYNQAAKEQLEAVKKMKSEYQRQAKAIFDTPTNSNTSTTTPTNNNKGGKKEIEYAVNSVGYLENKINELNNKIKLQVDYEEIKKLQKELVKTKGQLAELLQPTKKLDLSKIGGKGDFASATANIKKDLAEFLKREPLEIKIDKKSLSDQLNEFQDKAETIAGSFFSLDSVIGDIESLSDAISEGADAWHIFIGVLQTGLGIIETVSSTIEALNTIQELLGITTLATAEQSAAAGASEMATAAGVTTAKSIEAGATATAEATKLGFPALLFAIPLAIAAVIAGLSAIDGFANGGIVGGNSFGGDRLIARVNSGEAILNSHQQQHLFELLNNGNVSGTTGGNVQFVIKGKDLHGVLNNYNDKMKKVI